MSASNHQLVKNPITLKTLGIFGVISRDRRSFQRILRMICLEFARLRSGYTKSPLWAVFFFAIALCLTEIANYGLA